MLLTIATTRAPATELGYLLHKHPDKVQQFPQPWGVATVFYPEATDERCTAAILLEVDSVRLVRSRTQSPDFALSQYVNDRPYAASSLLAVALADVFRTARAGKCAARQELADSPLPLEIGLPALPCRGGVAVAEKVFAPLGWEVTASPIALDEQFPEWGESRYLNLQLRGELRLADALNQLHVLLPALDESKHYWQSSDEVDKLMRAGEGWLGAHPERELITRRYLGRRGRLAQAALERLAEIDELVDDVPGDGDEELGAASAIPLPNEQRRPLNEQRHEAVLREVRAAGAKSVIDLGCGPGQFLARLLEVPEIARIVGVDVSTRALQAAARRLRVEQFSERQAARLQLLQGALTYEDERFAGFDAAVLMEVVEHVDPARLAALEQNVFGSARPGTVIVTTPNREFNELYAGLVGHRHHDHRFEWDRAEFGQWCDSVAAAHGYCVSRSGIGEPDAEFGSPTQMAVFSRE